MNHLNILFTSASAEDRIQRILVWLSEQDTSRGALVIGATRTAADELVRLVAMSGDAVFGWHRLTLIQVARSIASWASEETAASVGHLGQKAILSRAVDALKTSNKLGRFERVSEFPGFVQAARDAIEEAGLQEVSEEVMVSETPDFSALSVEYRSQLREAGMVDRVDVITSARTALSRATHDPAGRAGWIRSGAVPDRRACGSLNRYDRNRPGGR